jgi:hypothetical protein
MMLPILVFLFYLAWGLLSLIGQGDQRLRKKMKTMDPLGLIPNYRFFCPNPLRADYHLYYRYRSAGDEIGEWKELPVGRRSRLAGFIWNPGKRDRKVFYKTIKLLREPGTNKTRSATYRALLSWIRQQDAEGPQDAVQFTIISKQDLSIDTVEKVIHTSRFYFKHQGYEQTVRS